MQRSVTFAVLVVEKVDPTKQINERYFTFAVTCPVQRRAASIIPRSQVKSYLFEKVYADRLVTLCGNMDHIDPKVVYWVLVGSVVKQKLA